MSAPVELAILENLASSESGPKSTKSLRSRGSSLASPEAQLRLLDAVPLESGDFDAALVACGWTELRPASLEILQINVGRLCNMTCRHCHVDAGPDRVAENMNRETIDLCLAALDKTSAHTVDITGGAPELNPHFRYLVDQCVSRGMHVIDRCNLTVLLLPRFAGLPVWFAEREVEVVCSLPHCRKRATDIQRGDGTFEKSIEALRRLNVAGYGHGDPRRRLTVMVNPVGAFLAAPQTALEREWKASLARDHSITFDRLITLNNMPISRFLEWLLESGNLQAYMERLTNAFNPATVAGLMCRNTLSIGWRGEVYDCDFNQQLGMQWGNPDRSGVFLWEIDPATIENREIMTGNHCFGCTAGAGSSCGGAIV